MVSSRSITLPSTITFQQQLLRLYRQLHVVGVGRAVLRLRQKADVAVLLKYRGLYLTQVKEARQPGHGQKFVDIQLCFFQLFPVQNTVLQQDKWFPPKKPRRRLDLEEQKEISTAVKP